jgi:hypothetical protein
MEKKNTVAIAMEKKDVSASVNRSDPPAMEKKEAVAITMEKKDAVASDPAADGVKEPVVCTTDGVQVPAVPDCMIPLDWYRTRNTPRRRTHMAQALSTSMWR